MTIFALAGLGADTMSPTRVSSLSAGYRLPSNLTLAARRPTGMTSIRLPQTRQFPAHCYAIPPGSSTPPECQDAAADPPVVAPSPGVVEASGKTALYVGLGVAALVAGYLVLSSASKMTANGRRRSRRRSRRGHRRGYRRSHARRSRRSRRR